MESGTISNFIEICSHTLKKNGFTLKLLSTLVSEALLVMRNSTKANNHFKPLFSVLVADEVCCLEMEMLKSH